MEEVQRQLAAPDGDQVVTIDFGEGVWVQGDFRIDVLATRWIVPRRKSCLRLGSAPDEKGEEPVRRSNIRSSSRWVVEKDEEGSQATMTSLASETMIVESNAQRLKSRVEAGKVAGLWIYA